MTIIDMSIAYTRADTSVCPYIYVPTQASYNCACPDEMQHTNQNCVPPEVKILITTETDFEDDKNDHYEYDHYEISSLRPEVNAQKSRNLLFEIDAHKNLFKGRPGYHYKHDLMFSFGIENNQNCLFSIEMKSHKSTKKIITSIGVQFATQLTVDWLGDTIYMINHDSSDYSNPRIEQIRIDGRSRRTVFWSEDLTVPHDIAVDPIAGFLFWTDSSHRPDYNKDKYRLIARATMSGQNIVPLLNKNGSGSQIRTITLDYRSKNIYFIDHDENSIKKISYFHKAQNAPENIKENRKHKIIFTSLGIVF